MNVTVEPRGTRAEGARTAPVISGRGVGKTFGGGAVIALEGATFDIAPGSFVSLVGPSGCGKSTLLRLIAGLIDRTSGHLTVHDRDVKGPHTDVGLMFQKATLLEWRTAVENVLLPLEIARTVTDEDRKRAMEFSTSSGSRTSPSPSRPSFRAACSSAWPSPGS